VIDAGLAVFETVNAGMPLANVQVMLEPGAVAAALKATAPVARFGV
jgi:hypothetical protein